MSGQNVIPLGQGRRGRSVVAEDTVIAMLVLMFVEAIMFAGMVSGFLLTRAATGGAWPPAGQPRLSLEETAINTAALLVSGALVFLAARAWEKRETRTAPLLTTAVSLGAFFVLFQGLEWVALIRDGLSPTSSPPSNFFCLIIVMQGAHALGALTFLGVSWLRLRRGSLGSGAFRAARILWYFVVGSWPVLYVCVYLL